MTNIVVLKAVAVDAALLGKYAHAGRTHPGFLHGMAVRLCAQPRYQGVTTGLEEMVKQPVSCGSSRWFPSETQSLELRNRRAAYARRRYRGYLLSVSDPARVDQRTFQRA